MGSLAVLMVATPIFGLSLQPPDMQAALSPSVQILNIEAAVDVSDAGLSNDGSDEGDSYEAQMKRRNSLAGVHRTFGIATWGAMLLTEVFGTIQYYNLYGTFSSLENTPCVQGTAVFGQGQCYGTPWLHLISGSVTTGLYATTLTLALMMPDPDNLSEGKGEFADTLRMHKLLRWIHLGGMVAQVALGVLLANGTSIGLDRTNNYSDLRLLATAHLAAGLVTFGALTWAGALMVF